MLEHSIVMKIFIAGICVYHRLTELENNNSARTALF